MIVPPKGATTWRPSLASTSWPSWMWPSRAAPKRFSALPKLCAPSTGNTAPSATVCAGVGAPAGGLVGAGTAGFGLGRGLGLAGTFGLGATCVWRAAWEGLCGVGLGATWGLGASTPYSLPPVPRLTGATAPPRPTASVTAAAGEAATPPVESSARAPGASAPANASAPMDRSTPQGTSKPSFATSVPTDATTGALVACTATLKACLMHSYSTRQGLPHTAGR